MGCTKKKVRFNPSGVPNEKKHPKLIKLLTDKTVWIENGEYIGEAADGIAVSLGTVFYEDAAEDYLGVCPEPKDW